MNWQRRWLTELMGGAHQGDATGFIRLNALRLKLRAALKQNAH
jgi:hypothetical protein